MNHAKEKYIIELEDAPFVGIDGDRLWRVKGFRSLVFDSEGLKRLTPAATAFAVDPKRIRPGDIVVDEDYINKKQNLNSLNAFPFSIELEGKFDENFRYV